MAVRDAAATQRRIVAAALKEFAAKGIAGARVDAIATRANTNKRMIYYYFRSKEGLFREILRQRLARRPGQPAPEDLPYAERIAMRTRVSASAESRDYTRLLMWEALETRSRNQKVMAEEERLAIYADLRDRVAKAQDAGELPVDLDPAQMVLSELALTLFPSAFPQLVRMVTGTAVDDPAFIAAREAHLVRLIEHLAEQPIPRA